MPDIKIIETAFVEILSRLRVMSVCFRASMRVRAPGNKQRAREQPVHVRRGRLTHGTCPERPSSRSLVVVFFRTCRVSCRCQQCDDVAALVISPPADAPFG